MKNYGTGSVTICFLRQTVRFNMQNALRNSGPKPRDVEDGDGVGQGSGSGTITVERGQRPNKAR